jgi:hypothetical protein
MAACNKHNDPEKHRPKRSASLHCNAPLVRTAVSRKARQVSS